MRTISVADAMDRETIRRIVSKKVPEKWRRASLTLMGSDEESTYSFFTSKSEMMRVETVRAFFEKGCPWSPFIIQPIAKTPSWGKVAAAARSGRSPWRRDPTEATRVVAYDTRVNHAAQLVLLEILQVAFRRGTPWNVIGFVPGVDPFERLVAVITMVQSAPEKFRFARAYDLQGAFDSLDWGFLDRAIDQHLGEVVGGTPGVEGALREALKGLVRVPWTSRDGTQVPRHRGVLQGGVLSPWLLNIYLRNLDRRVIKKAASLGCLYFRFADDILLVGPSLEVMDETSRFFEAEVERLRLTVKAGTGQTHDLKNPNSPVEWLGIEFTHADVRVPRSRIERKAAHLLLRLRRGQLGLSGLERSLGQLREHYSSLVGDDGADRAVEAIRRLLRPFLQDVPEEQGGINHIIMQLPSSRTGRPTRSRTPLGSGSYRSREGDPRRGSLSRSPWTPTGPASATELQGPNDGRHPAGDIPSDTPQGRDSAAPTAARDTGSSSGSHQEMMSSSSPPSSPPADGLPLEARSTSVPRPEPSPEDQAQERTGKIDSTPRAAPTPVAKVWVRAHGRRRGRVVVTFSDVGIFTFTFSNIAAQSSAEVILDGYRRALGRLTEFEGVVELRVTNRVVHGHMFAKERIRSPFVLRRWVELTPLLGGHVTFVDGQGTTRGAEAGR